MKATADVFAGACGFQTLVQAHCDDGQQVTLQIQTPCAKMQKLALILSERGPLDVFEEMNPSGAGTLVASVQSAGCCTGCVLPSALSKAMQISAGLMLAKDVSIQLRQE